MTHRGVSNAASVSVGGVALTADRSSPASGGGWALDDARGLSAHAAQPSFDTEMALERTIKTNVAGDLGITVKFSDADGDG